MLYSVLSTDQKTDLINTLISSTKSITNLHITALSVGFHLCHPALRMSSGSPRHRVLRLDPTRWTDLKRNKLWMNAEGQEVEPRFKHPKPVAGPPACAKTSASKNFRWSQDRRRCAAGSSPSRAEAPNIALPSKRSVGRATQRAILLN